MDIEMISSAIDDDIEADAHGLPDLGHAMSQGRVREMEQCVLAIFNTPPEVMCSEDKFSHLWLSGGLYGAFRHGQADTAAGFTRLVASAPGHVLEPSMQLRLLSWPVSTRLHFDVPLLHSIAGGREADGHPQLRLQQQRAIFGYVHEVAVSTNLTVALKTRLCGASHGNPSTTAAQAALGNDNPGAAAAMMCGILSASCDELLQQTLFECLGASLRDVISALACAGHREDSQWTPLLMALLDGVAPG